MASSTVRQPARSERTSPRGATGSALAPIAAGPNSPNGKRPHGRARSIARPRRERERRIVRIALVVSLVIHVLFFGIARFIVLSGDDGSIGLELPTVTIPDDATMEVLAIRPVAEPPAEATPPDAVTPTPAPPRPVTVDPRPAPTTERPVDARPTTTPARDRFNEAIEALRPRLLDPRLRPGNAADLRTDHERAVLRVYARINALNDSLMAEAARRGGATDWTWTDEDGRRWGVSPGKLHLGNLEIPLPLNFDTPEQRARVLEWNEIQAQAERAAIGETFDERVEAIRRERERQRSEE